MFSFDLDESITVARRIVDSKLKAQKTVDAGWERLVKGYREAKAPLIEALDPKTGRIEVQVEVPPNETALKEVIYNWIVDDMGIRGHTMYSEPYNTIRCYFANYIIDPEISWIASAFQALGASKGQKPTRAVAAMLRKIGMDDDAVTKAVTKLGDRLAAVSKRQGKLALSANFLDIWMLSEFAPFTSCMTIVGTIYSSGLPQFLLDSHMMVAYYYETTKSLQGIGGPDEQFPHKLCRYILTVDRENHSVTLGSQQGQRIRKEALNFLLEPLGRVVGVELKMMKAEENYPNFYRNPDDCLGHPDYGEYLFYSKDGGYVNEARLVHKSHVPCLCCGNGVLFRQDRYPACRECMPQFETERNKPRQAVLYALA